MHAAHHHVHAVDAAEAPQRHAFVGHSVLAADHRDIVSGGRVQVRQGALGMLALDAQDDHVAIAKIDVPGMVGGGHANPHVLNRRNEPKPLVFDGPEVRAAGDERDVVTALEQARADAAADPAGAVDDVPGSFVHEVSCRHISGLIQFVTN